MTQFTSTQKTVRSTLLAVSFAALLTGCGSMNSGGEAKTDLVERQSTLVCVVQDPKQNIEQLERAVVEGVKATGVTARVVKEGDNVAACKGLLSYGVVVKDRVLTGFTFQMNNGSEVVLRNTWPAKDGKMTLHQVSAYAAIFVNNWLTSKSEEQSANSKLLKI